MHRRNWLRFPGTGRARRAARRRRPWLASTWGPLEALEARIVLSGLPPVAINDAYTIDEDGFLDVVAPGVLANDTDAEGDTLTARLVSRPASGAFALLPSGAFR